MRSRESSGFGESDSSRLFPETLTTEIKAIFTDDASLMGTQPTLSAAFTVFAGAGKPNSVVCHFWKRLGDVLKTVLRDG